MVIKKEKKKKQEPKGGTCASHFAYDHVLELSPMAPCCLHLWARKAGSFVLSLGTFPKCLGIFFMLRWIRRKAN